LQFAEAINQLTANTAGVVRRPLPVDDPKQRRPDISKARRVLHGWEPAVPLEQGLAATVADYRKRLGLV
jgi:nucleoside-diphosphate-sugar epimerase